MKSLPSVSALAIGIALAAPALANDRHFAYLYETAVLPPGGRELEVSTTFRTGRDDFYSRLDQRLEFEVGLTEKVMTAFYLNWSNTTSEVSTDVLGSQFAWQGVSSEWKWKLSDPVADPIGFALYGELGYATDAIELEAKTLFDKKVGKILWAANLVAEGEFEAEPDEYELEEIELEADFGASYAVSPHLSVGLELRNHNEIAKVAGSEEMEFEHSALFFGPNVSYATESWWMTFSILPQLPALMKAGDGGILVLDEHEKINARLLFSFHI